MRLTTILFSIALLFGCVNEKWRCYYGMPGEALLIGGLAGTNILDGYIDDFQIWNRALSAAEVATLAARTTESPVDAYTTYKLRFNNTWLQKCGNGKFIGNETIRRNAIMLSATYHSYVTFGKYISAIRCLDESYFNMTIKCLIYARRSFKKTLIRKT